jgi:NAD(P)-dependent dehydrogenase (short-subunit alcohol dehydrogenase family)
MAPYTASKRGITGMSLGLANELAALNIRVNTVNPAGVATGMAPASLHGLLSEKRPDLVGIYENALPVPLVEARDVSNAILFLVSDESRYVTGLEFKVDAGATIR